MIPPAVALLFSAIGATYIVYNVKGNSTGSGGLSLTSRKERVKQALQKQITRIMTFDGWRSSIVKMLTAKEGGANGIPVSSYTGKLIVLYLAGQSTEDPDKPGSGIALYPNYGNIYDPDTFEQIVDGNYGPWGLTGYNVDDFTYPGLENFTLDEGNDFGLRRNTGTWLEDTFNLTCLATVVASAAATVASGGTLAPGGIAASAYACRTQ